MIFWMDLLRDADFLKTRLRGDGWRLETDDTGRMSVHHPEVRSESEARKGLNELGLLTSGNLRIEFPLRRRAPVSLKF